MKVSSLFMDYSLLVRKDQFKNMTKNIKRFEREFGGRKLIIETGKLAAQAGGACTVQYGDTVVLATATMGKTVRDNIDYFPLMVDFEERLYAAGKIKGSRWIKREGRPSEDAILSGRIIDRSIRPLFDEKIRNDVQVILTVLCYDGENDSSVPALIAASTAVMISSIPWAGPVAAVKIGYQDGKYIINPKEAEQETDEMNLFLAGSQDKTIMIEADAKETPEDIVFGAIELGHKEILPVIELIEEVAREVGVAKIVPDVEKLTDEQLTVRAKIEADVNNFFPARFKEIVGVANKTEREEKITKIFTDLNENLKQKENLTEDDREYGMKYLTTVMDNEVRRLLMEDGKRIDGRQFDEIRPLSCEVGVLPRTHGSGLFQRGETQVLSIITLGAPGDEQQLDSMEETGTKRYMHHYNFPPYSVGEVGPMRGPGRREIGHGALAEKALFPVLPEKEAFPYTIRVVSEVLGSNGSSSQASVCGSTLALMDAGVPIKNPVAGISMGLALNEETNEYILLTDIQGTEDHSFNMDYKVAGTEKGITAIQLDIKGHGLPIAVSKDTLAGAKKARLQILAEIKKIIAEPRKELSPYAPRIITIRIDPEQIRTVIGKGGETIQGIIEECGGRDICKIDIEDDGLVMITTTDPAMGEKAKKWIENLTRVIEVGEIFEGPVTQIIKDQKGGEIGAIVELAPGRDGMVHISQFRYERIEKVSDVVKIGDMLKVKVMEIDTERGRISLSHKVFEPRPEGFMEDNGGDRRRPPQRRDDRGSSRRPRR